VTKDKELNDKIQDNLDEKLIFRLFDEFCFTDVFKMETRLDKAVFIDNVAQSANWICSPETIT